MNSPIKSNLQRFHKGDVLWGASFNLGSPTVCELAATLNLDWALLDWEHGLWNDVTLPLAIRNFAGSPVLCVVRVPHAEGPWIKKVLDWGADGVLVPGIRNLAEARACVDEAKYAPVGCRGVGPLRPSEFYAKLHETVAGGNERTLLWLMIEKTSMFKELAEICAMEGVDGFMIGRNDLAQSMGRAFSEAREETNELARQAMSACVTAGKAAGCFRGTPEETSEWLASGARLILLGDDVQFLRNGFKAASELLGFQGGTESSSGQY